MPATSRTVWLRTASAAAILGLLVACSDDADKAKDADAADAANTAAPSQDVPQSKGQDATDRAAEDAAYKAANAAFAADFRTQDGVTALEGGVAIKFIKRGAADARQAQVGDYVTIFYKGTLTNGSQFDARQRPDAPAQFDLGGLIQGWQDALPQMREGDVATIMVPADRGYGTRDTPSIPANSTLLFEIELVKTQTGEEVLAEFTAAQSAYLEENAKADGVTVTATGLQYKVLEMGDGEKPGIDAIVTAHYEGKLIDGAIFDSSFQRGQPADFPLENVIAGWTEGLQLMPVGSTFEFTIPADLGYGERGSPPRIPGGATLVFKVKLEGFKSRKEEFAERQRLIDANIAFVDAAKESADVVTSSGVAITFIEKGEGRKPGPDDIVKVHYTGTLYDGAVFDDTYERDLPQHFQLTNIIPGWKESLQEIPEGSTVEVVIPQEQGYGKQGAEGIPPYSALKFKIELLDVSTPEEETARLEQRNVEQTAWLAENGKKDGVKTLESGIQYKVIKAGEGDVAVDENRIKFHYKGVLTDGRVFVDSVGGEPNVQPLSVFDPSLREALGLIPAGGIYEVYVPAELAFGAAGRGSLIPPYSTIVYTFEMLEIFK